MYIIGFDHCDLVESSSRLLYEAPQYIGFPSSDRCTFINCGLEEFHPPEDYYDLVWYVYVCLFLV